MGSLQDDPGDLGDVDLTRSSGSVPRATETLERIEAPAETVSRLVKVEYVLACLVWLCYVGRGSLCRSTFSFQVVLGLATQNLIGPR